tara:strand:+ start:746 stop:1624 length:879 start_codon:yes stop_codon:yes gene_type:complete
MNSLAELIIKVRPHLSPGSVKTYIANLKRIGIETRSDIEKLKSPEFLFDQFEGEKLSTKRNMTSSALIIAMAEYPDNQEIWEPIRQRMFDLGTEYNEEASKNQKSETQEKNWVKLGELKKIANKLLKENPKSQDSLIAGLYTMQPPTRLDFYDMEIKNGKAEMSDKKNYLVIHNTRRKEFVFNDFKTKNKYNQVIIKVNKDLNRVINKFLKLNPDRKYLLQKVRSPQPLSRNQLGKAIPIIFKETGKNVTLNIIRHVYISEQVDLEALKKFQEIAKSMMHSQSMQQEYAKTD